MDFKCGRGGAISIFKNQQQDFCYFNDVLEILAPPENNTFKESLHFELTCLSYSSPLLLHLCVPCHLTSGLYQIPPEVSSWAGLSL